MRDNVPRNSPTYHPSYEFPGVDETPSHPALHVPNSSTLTPPNDFPICRLVMQEGRFISQKRRLAVIDGYSEVQFGRDAPPAGSSTPRIRLKDMEVSKLHATLFWDVERAEWAVVDMGSKHGTFVGSGQDTNRVRLSASRVASMPKRLKHSDRLSLGGTTFVVHIHEDRLPCSDCSASGQGTDDLIPLFSHRTVSSGTIAQADRGHKRGADPTNDVPRNAKRALLSLKQSLLSRPGGFVPTASPHDEPTHASSRESMRGCGATVTGSHRGSTSSPSPHVANKRTASQEPSRFVPIVKEGEEGDVASEPASDGERTKRRLRTRDARH